jgi:hypothetical protein
MTMTRSKNSTCELPIYGRSTILRPMIFFQDGVAMEFLHGQFVMGTQIVFILNLGGEISYFDYHRRFLPSDHPFRLDSNCFRKDNIVLKGPPRHLSSPEIIDMLDNLALDKTRDQFVGYAKKSIIGPTMWIVGTALC